MSAASVQDEAIGGRYAPGFFRWLVSGVGLAVSGVVLSVTGPDIGWGEAIMLMLPAWAFLAAGWIAWGARPASRTGLLLMLTGVLVTSYEGHYQATSPLLWTVSATMMLTWVPIGAVLVAGFPDGRVRARAERTSITAGSILAVLVEPVHILLTPPGDVCTRCAGHRFGSLDLLAQGSSSTPAHLWITFAAFAGTGFLIVGVRHLVRRALWVSAAGRRVLAPVLLSTAVAVIPTGGLNFAQGFARLHAVDVFASSTPAIWRVALVASGPVLAAVAFGFLAGLLRTRVTRSRLGELLVGLAEPQPGERLEALLADALGDPTLKLAFVLPDGDLVDPGGHTVTLPEPDRTDAAVTVIHGQRGRLAALIHDPALAHDEGLLDAVAGAARLSLENGRLQAELRAQLEAVRESRQRIVEAGDQARKKIERDLHDGAQQRLVGLTLTLRLAERQLSPDTNARPLLESAITEAQSALRDLRELARGLHPQILTEDGLGSALQSLADRAATPVQVLTAPDRRAPEAVEACAYFVVSEALQNVAKHAQANRTAIRAAVTDDALKLEISDDGVGGARLDTGSGLLGLRDRIETLGGELELQSPKGAGTRILATIPILPSSDAPARPEHESIGPSAVNDPVSAR